MLCRISSISAYVKMLPKFSRGAQMHTMLQWLTCNNSSRNIPNINKITQRYNKSENTGTRMHQVTNLDKRILVWVKRYPSIAEIPQNVTEECMLSARGKMRVKICNYMIVAIVIACVVNTVLGKQQAEKGDNLIKQRKDWYKEIAEKNK
ncbi:hypothetical protein HN011_007620 [Eciton burchellii]|nr:hypothetical protein HN011_007620 [Eciton burchellii]